MFFKKHKPAIRPLTQKIIGSLDVGTATCSVRRNIKIPGWFFVITFEYIPDTIKLKILDGAVLLDQFDGDDVLFTDVFNRDEQYELRLRLDYYKDKAKETYYNAIENRIAFGIKKPRKW
ncbi:hypothetical protein [Aeromonas phage 65.2]|uniref:Uncharacterized protein n=1 Tax=Aeromonas phage 65.2 TaxID=1932896 RepID=A0A219YCL7_9CAUD|nr:hypothetical protein [Aeromonas phage 65.2]